jgi:sugar phosphate isomerase/epimerase
LKFEKGAFIFVCSADNMSSMASSRSYSLAYLSTAPLNMPGMLDLAARLGYQHICARLTRVTANIRSPALIDAVDLRETVARIRDTGVTVLGAEVVWLHSEFRIDIYEPLLAAASELGARAIVAISADNDEARATGSFASLCEAAASYGLAVGIEFMPWTPVPDANAAVRLVQNSGSQFGRVLIDSIHVARSQTRLQDLSAIPHEMLEYFHICDASSTPPQSMDGKKEAARSERLLPGEGQLDLAGMLSKLPIELPISVEVPNIRRLRALGAEEWARRALAAARRVVEGQQGG